MHRQAEPLVERFVQSRDFHSFSESSDNLWLWLNLYGPDRFPALDRCFPKLPPAEVQLQFTGKTGNATLRDGFRIYKMFRNCAEAELGGLNDKRVLDFGCGWGRVMRFFLRDVGAGFLSGFDVEPAVLDLARVAVPSARFTQVEPTPPCPVDDCAFDFIYSYSVFSHLSERSHLEWLAELHRLLKPGGILAVTTRPREFIEGLRRRRSRGEDQTLIPAAFFDTNEALRRYDAGEYVHEPTGGGGELSASFFGETCIPPEYVRRHWAQWFEIVDYVHFRQIGEQNLIVAARP